MNEILESLTNFVTTLQMEGYKSEMTIELTDDDFYRLSFGFQAMHGFNKAPDQVNSEILLAIGGTYCTIKRKTKCKQC